MVQLKLLSGTMAGTTWGARRFPVRIGRSARADFQLEAEGVWDEHIELALEPRQGFKLRALPNALVRVNGEPTESAFLRNGDTIQLGSATLQFWLGETRQASLAFREALTWLGIGAVCLAQIALVYYLLMW